MQSVVAARYPLKSARGDALETAVIETAGVRGDPTLTCIDLDDGTVSRAKHPRRWGSLLDVGTRLRDDGPDATLTRPVDGRSLRAGSGEADGALGEHLGRGVRLKGAIGCSRHRTLPDDSGMVPDWTERICPGQDTVTTVAGVRQTRRFVDFAAVHIVTTRSVVPARQTHG